MNSFWEKNEKKKKALESAKDSLKDIIPVKSRLEKLKSGDKDIEDLLDEAKFQAKLESELGYEPSREESREILKKALNELKEE